MRCALPLALFLAACDVATPEPPRAIGPDVHVLAIYPPDGAGSDCDVGTADCGVPTNATLAFRFDRFLNPATANRQALRVYSGAGESSSFLRRHVR